MMSDQPFVERRRTWNAGLRAHFRELEERWNRAQPRLAVVHLPPPTIPGAPPPGLADIGLPEECLRTLETKRPNLLLIGSSRNVTCLLQLIEPLVTQPVVSVRAERLTLPEAAIGTLVLHDANRLSPSQQDQLHRWVDMHPLNRVIATTSEPLFPLVVRNMFSAVLFFRLNVMSLMIEEASPEIV
jgi:hypothetical protein